MLIAKPSGGRGTNRSSSVGHFSFFMSLALEVCTKSRFDKRPCSLVLRLFLSPTLFSVGVSLGGVNERLEGEGSKLL